MHYNRLYRNAVSLMLAFCILMASSFSVFADEPEITLPGGASSIQEMFEEAVSAAESTPKAHHLP